jgi:hypothetical protein
MDKRLDEGRDHVSCEDCIPKLLPSNRDAAEVYFLVQGQLIIGGMSGEIIDINYCAVLGIIELLGIEDRLGCFMKVRAAFNHMQQVRRDTKGAQEIFNG